VTRLLGYIGAYLWTYIASEEHRTLAINVHMYSSAKLCIPFSGRVAEVLQSSDWPWDGKINFELSVPPGLSVSLRLRIPAWADHWEVTCLFPVR
jgi:DUF1680 family protein